MIFYVLGFAFYGDEVLLIRKNRPLWQQGKLNGIGGKIEEIDANPWAAMQREFKEECGLTVSDWKHYVTLGDVDGSAWKMVVFTTELNDIHSLHSATDEVVGLYSVEDIITSKEEIMSNLPWLITLAKDCHGIHPPFIGYDQ
jgi:8-oxo-dGTP diphosphatase